MAPAGRSSWGRSPTCLTKTGRFATCPTMGASAPRQPVEDLDAAVEGAVVRGVADAEVRVAGAEDSPRDNEQVVADRLGDELRPGPPGRLREQVKRPAGVREFESVLQARHEPAALAAIVGDVAGHVVL